jgi:hypothetical protein
MNRRWIDPRPGRSDRCGAPQKVRLSMTLGWQNKRAIPARAYDASLALTATLLVIPLRSLP